mgnify:CR=1 FL=1
MCSKSEALKILSEVNESVRQQYNNKVRNCYLYGSYARGDYHSESDVDIAVILPMNLNEINKTNSYIGHLSSVLSLKYDVTVSIVTISDEYFIKYAEDLPFYMNIIKEGVKI